MRLTRILFIIMILAAFAPAPVFAQDEELEAELAQLKEDYAKLEADYAELEEENADLVKQVEKLKNDARKLRKERGALQREIEDLQAELSAALRSDPTATPTPKATSTPKPTSTPTSTCATAAEEDFLLELAVIAVVMGTTIQEMEEIANSGSSMTQVYLLVEKAREFHGQYQYALTMTPPSERVRPLYDQVLAALYHLDLMATYLEQGVDTFDMTLIDLATAEMNLAADEVNKATVTLERLQDELCLD